MFRSEDYVEVIIGIDKAQLKVIADLTKAKSILLIGVHNE